jgi:hypothetical protein
MARLALLCLTLSACASPADCGPDWYQVGERDGRINAGSQVASYSQRCASPPDAARYAEGYAAGFARRPIPNW